MKRGLIALMIGSSFFGMLLLLGHLNVATPFPLVMLSPGILAGAFAPGSGFNIEGDIHPWGVFSKFIVFAVDVTIYGGLVYLYLSLRNWRRKSSK
jgi:hypothetical protein